METALVDGGGQKARVFELDLRDLPPPQPLLRILDALPLLLDAGMSLRARTPCRPDPLLAQLEAAGYEVEVAVTAYGDACVTIRAGHGRTRD